MLFEANAIHVAATQGLQQTETAQNQAWKADEVGDRTGSAAFTLTASVLNVYSKSFMTF